MVNETMRHFADQKAPDGTPWAHLAPATLEARKRQKRARRAWTGERILQVTGAYKNSIGVMDLRDDSAKVGPVGGVEQLKARTHQFGRGQMPAGLPFGGHPIPARPQMGFTPTNEKYLTEELADELMEGVHSG